MWPDFGMAGAENVASPSTCTPGAAVASSVSQFTPTQRALMFARPAWWAMSPARWGGTTFSTSALMSSNSKRAVLVVPSTCFNSALGRYSSRPA